MDLFGVEWVGFDLNTGSFGLNGGIDILSNNSDEVLGLGVDPSGRFLSVGTDHTPEPIFLIDPTNGNLQSEPGTISIASQTYITAPPQGNKRRRLGK